MSTVRIAIGSRGSALALAQARLVSAALERLDRKTHVVIVETEGDRRAPDTAWGEGAFVAAIEHALLDGHVDIAVHSAKDVPIDQDQRLRIAAYLPRADPRDALVVRSDATERRLADLQPGTRVGTDSPRRAGFIRALRPDLVVHALHGNVDTRLRRLDDGETDAVVLACAGLDRLGLTERISERLAPDVVPPAPGQGAVAVQIRANDTRMLALVAAIDDPRNSGRSRSRAGLPRDVRRRLPCPDRRTCDLRRGRAGPARRTRGSRWIVDCLRASPRSGRARQDHGERVGLGDASPSG